MPTKSKTKTAKKIKYEYEYVPYHEITQGSVDAENLRKIFTCAPGGVCREDTVHPAIENLTEYLNRRGGEGWNLVQMFPQDKGILYLFKSEA